MKLNLLEQIVCPQCHTNFLLKIRKKQNDEIIEGTLTCIKKHNCFPGDSRVMTVNGEIQMKDLKV